jgi:hypothetical protein
VELLSCCDRYQQVVVIHFNGAPDRRFLLIVKLPRMGVKPGVTEGVCIALVPLYTRIGHIFSLLVKALWADGNTSWTLSS